MEDQVRANDLLVREVAHGRRFRIDGAAEAIPISEALARAMVDKWKASSRAIELLFTPPYREALVPLPGQRFAAPYHQAAHATLGFSGPDSTMFTGLECPRPEM